jgi:hypothetical protein
MAEITTTATGVQIQNQFDSDVTVAIIAEPSRDLKTILFDSDTPIEVATVGTWGEFHPNEGWG